MPGGPADGSVIPSFAAHVASYVWDGKQRDVLTNLVEKNLYIGGGIHCDSIIKACHDEDDRAPETRAIGFLLVTLRSTLFVDKNGSREYFPCFRPHPERLVILPDAPRAAQWDVLCEPKSMECLYGFRARLDSLTANEVMWFPYGQQPYEAHSRTLMTGFISHHGVIEPYLPERCLRQLGFQQIIPQKIPQPLRVYRGEDPKAYTVVWPDRFTPIVPRSASTTDDIGWYQTFSHPWIVNDRDVVQPYGLDAIVGEYWMAEFSQKAGFIFDPIVDQLP
ncbi:Protein MAINTENANCE OF MERISTEMS [Bienertia sinuspersici]